MTGVAGKNCPAGSAHSTWESQEPLQDTRCPEGLFTFGCNSQSSKQKLLVDELAGFAA